MYYKKIHYKVIYRQKTFYITKFCTTHLQDIYKRKNNNILSAMFAAQTKIIPTIAILSSQLYMMMV